ncbi:uncharacterized protein METZ01_LOCUS398064 [marine metagenome]|uniref:Uncharacterized protein n=1 Tax=marine metagenome TaxID=408172 RepID=A0A382VFP0_9ZZZZ
MIQLYLETYKGLFVLLNIPVRHRGDNRDG